MKNLWEKFDDLTGKSYSNMIGAEKNFNVWHQAFSVLTDIVKQGRESNPDYGMELVDLEEDTDFAHDISGWLEDYLDEMDMREDYAELERVCEKLLDLFEWKEDSPSDLRFRLSSALSAQGKNKEALQFCEEWYKEEDSVTAATALIYARMSVKDLQGAEELVKRYITEKTECTEENDIVYIAAAALYKVKGDKKAERIINEALEKYDRELEEYFLGWGEDEEDFDFLDDDF